MPLSQERGPASRPFLSAPSSLTPPPSLQNYDEAGNQKRIQCLKYLILGKMLSLEEANIFEAPEVTLFDAFQRGGAKDDILSQ